MTTDTATKQQTAFVLVVEDEEAHGEAIAEGLRRAGHACHVVSSAADAIESIRKRPPDVVVTDYRLAGDDGPTGLDVLHEAKKASPESEVILITAYGSERLAREALGGDGQARAFDYLTKPVDLEDVREIVSRAAAKAIAGREAKRLSERLREAMHFEGIVAGSQVMHRVLQVVRRIAPTKITALVVGETGTGKELVARAIHANSTRKSKPYKVINCAGLNENLLESELFGHVRGAFTGAISERKGLLEAADGGTVFLDEVGDMPLTMQAKLLRALESGEVLPVGSNETRHTDVRVIAATHRDLRELIKDGKFREDLYYRVNVLKVELPPLRERREDIPLLAEALLARAARDAGRPTPHLPREVLAALAAHEWPGNVRELENEMRRIVVLTGEEVRLEHLSQTVIERRAPLLNGAAGPALAEGGGSIREAVADLEKRSIEAAIASCGGNKSRAAKLLGISRFALQRKLDKYGLGSVEEEHEVSAEEAQGDLDVTRSDDS